MRSWLFAISGSIAIDLVSEGEDGSIVLRRARMWLFFQDEGKIEDGKVAFMRSVRRDIIEGAQSFSIDVDMWSGPQQLE